jgi:enoyl-CoA hydratase
MTILTDAVGRTLVVTIDRPGSRNAIDGPTATALHDAFTAFDADDGFDVAVLEGADGTFCAGADLKAIGQGTGNRVHEDMAQPGPLGCTRLLLSKPVVAAVEGHAVAGGLELALWCDLRVAAEDAVFGVFCRRWGVPLIDGGTVRLPRLIGQSHALDLILTGRPVAADEALRMGLANRVSAPGAALDEAVALAEQIAAFPQTCMRQDRLSTYDQHGLPLDRALDVEWVHGGRSLLDALTGAARFRDGEGRGGSF